MEPKERISHLSALTISARKRAAWATADPPTFEHDFESPTVGDESVTLVREEDPLRNFFFAPKGEGTTEDFLEGDKGGKSKAAQILSMNRTTLIEKMKRLGLD